MTEDLDPGFEVLPTPTPRRRAKLLASIAAVVVLGAGGVTAYVAFAAGDSGAGSPNQAVQKVFDDLQHADLIGVIDDLAPGERTALSPAVGDDIAALKRLGVLSAQADGSAVSGVEFATHDLKYGSPIKVNDDVAIAQLTGGTIDLNATLARLPFTTRLLGLAHGPSTTSKHVNITQPIRIAAQRVGGKWYASLFYTIADQAADHRIPTAADEIPAKGTGTASDAVQSFVHAIFAGDYGPALTLISPAELGAVHDYGNLLVASLPQHAPLPVTLQTLDLTSTTIPGGVRVGIHDLTLTAKGRQIHIAFENGCASISAGPLNQRICAADAADRISTYIGAIMCAQSFRFGATSGKTPGACHGPTFTAAQKTAIGDVLTALTKAGIDLEQVDGDWYIAPVRTVADMSTTLLSSLHGDDLFQLATLRH